MGLYFSDFQDKSERGALISSKICSNSSILSPCLSKQSQCQMLVTINLNPFLINRSVHLRDINYYYYYFIIIINHLIKCILVLTTYLYHPQRAPPQMILIDVITVCSVWKCLTRNMTFLLTSKLLVMFLQTQTHAKPPDKSLKLSFENIVDIYVDEVKWTRLSYPPSTL